MWQTPELESDVFFNLLKYHTALTSFIERFQILFFNCITITIIVCVGCLVFALTVIINITLALVEEGFFCQTTTSEERDLLEKGVEEKAYLTDDRYYSASSHESGEKSRYVYALCTSRQ